MQLEVRPEKPATRSKQEENKTKKLLVISSIVDIAVTMSEVCSLNEPMMRMPALFVNHGGGPMPLMGRQPMIAHHLQESVTKYITEKPRAIVVISAHHEANPIAITSSAKPSMYFDYYGFPPETYEFKYPAPGNPELARQIQNLLSEKGIESQLDAKRGLDHGAFVPLMLMYPDADIPVVCVSLHSSLSPDIHLALGNALAPLQDQGTS
jgi:aromatic ring-opening dioxygenase catalytic subunit (LigB family)